MRHLTSSVLVFLTIFINYSCEEKSMDAQSIVAQAYDAHGGKANWDNINELRYVKESVVYNDDGTIRLKNKQEHYYTYKPYFVASIDWEVGNDLHQITYTDAAATKNVNGTLVNDQAVAESAYNAVNAARYTVSQPFKLSDKGVQLTYEGIDELEEGQKVHVVKASYNMENENHTDNDEWWYFFEVDTYLCLATMVHHGTTYSYIKNLEFDRSTNIVFNYHRKGYSVDSARNILFFQSEYFYRNYRIEGD